MSGSTRDWRSRFTRRQFILGSGVTAAGMVLYSGEIARHEMEIVDRTIHIDNLPAGLNGFRMVLLSDIHLDEYTEPFFLDRIVKRINALKPDLVLLNGDYVTHGSLSFLFSKHAPYRCAEILSTLTAPQVYAVLGNHDVAFGADVVTRSLTQFRIPVLINSYVPIERAGDRFWLCGLEDPGTSSPDPNLAIPAKPDGPIILMSHEPDYADVIARHPRGPLVDLILAGHTHGGQIRLPVLGALILPPMGQKYVQGHFQLNRMQLYVNRGIGTVGLPFRLNCPPEVTVITLQPA
ncbi:MAG TPA: metallophosphoesterase [Edaphobacter sp.]